MIGKYLQKKNLFLVTILKKFFKQRHFYILIIIDIHFSFQRLSLIILMTDEFIKSLQAVEGKQLSAFYY